MSVLVLLINNTSNVAAEQKLKIILSNEKYAQEKTVLSA